MSRSTVTATTSALLIAAVLAAGTACSSESDGGGPDQAKEPKEPVIKVPDTPVARAVATMGKTTARIDEKIEITARGSGVAISIAGAFDFAGDQGKLSADLPDHTPDHMDELFAGGKVYLRPLGNTDKKKWAVIDRDKARAHLMLRSPVNDPEHLLRQISTMRKMTKKGTERIGTTTATHYRGTLDHATLSMRLDPEIRRALDAIRQKRGSDLPVDADAWVDADGRLARAVISWQQGETTGKITVNFSRFGAPVKVAAPPKSETAPVENPQGTLPG